MTDQPATTTEAEKIRTKRESGMFSPITGSIKLLKRWWRMAVQSEVN